MLCDSYQGIVRNMHSFLELVLHLRENDGPSFGVLICCNDLSDVLDPWSPSSMICNVGSPEVAAIAWVSAGTVGKVESKATSICLGITVGTRSGDDCEASQLSFSQFDTLLIL